MTTATERYLTTMLPGTVDGPVLDLVWNVHAEEPVVETPGPRRICPRVPRTLNHPQWEEPEWKRPPKVNARFSVQDYGATGSEDDSEAILDTVIAAQAAPGHNEVYFDELPEGEAYGIPFGWGSDHNLLRSNITLTGPGPLTWTGDFLKNTTVFLLRSPTTGVSNCYVDGVTLNGHHEDVTLWTGELAGEIDEDSTEAVIENVEGEVYLGTARASFVIEPYGTITYESVVDNGGGTYTLGEIGRVRTTIPAGSAAHESVSGYRHVGIRFWPPSVGNNEDVGVFNLTMNDWPGPQLFFNDCKRFRAKTIRMYNGRRGGVVLWHDCSIFAVEDVETYDNLDDSIALQSLSGQATIAKGNIRKGVIRECSVETIHNNCLVLKGCEDIYVENYLAVGSGEEGPLNNKSNLKIHRARNSFVAEEDPEDEITYEPKRIAVVGFVGVNSSSAGIAMSNALHAEDIYVEGEFTDMRDQALVVPSAAFNDPDSDEDGDDGLDPVDFFQGERVRLDLTLARANRSETPDVDVLRIGVDGGAGRGRVHLRDLVLHHIRYHDPDAYCRDLVRVNGTSTGEATLRAAPHELQGQLFNDQSDGESSLEVEAWPEGSIVSSTAGTAGPGTPPAPSFPPTTTLTNVTEPTLSLPGYQVWTDEPSFDTEFVRITDSTTFGGATEMGHHYAKTQAWNADESLIMLAGGGNSAVHLVHADTLDYLGDLPVGSGAMNPVWSNVDPDKIYYVSGSQLRRYSIGSDSSALIQDFGSTLGALNGQEGDASDDDTVIVLTTSTEIISYNPKDDVEHGRISKPANFNHAHSSRLSESDVILVGLDAHGSLADGLRLYPIDLSGGGTEIFPGYAGHGDFALLEGGGETFVCFDFADLGGAFRLAAYDLPSGPWRTVLDPYGASGWVSGHVSGRGRPGWVVLSDYERSSPYSSAKGFDETFALHIDSSEDVQRYVHQHCSHPTGSVVPYEEMAQSTVSRNGEKVLWGTRWANKWDQAASGHVHSFIARAA